MKSICTSQRNTMHSAVSFTPNSDLEDQKDISFSASVFSIFRSPQVEETEEIICSPVMYGDREEGREER